jgi:hypothetical protein
MFDLFKNRPRDVKEIRNAILQFIKEQLQKAEGGEGSNIRGLYLYINCGDDEKHLYELAVFYDSPDRFKNDEVQKIADDFAIALPAGWTLEEDDNLANTCRKSESMKAVPQHLQYAAHCVSLDCPIRHCQLGSRASDDTKQEKYVI